jgi:hypothetical protein
MKSLIVALAFFGMLAVMPIRAEAQSRDPLFGSSGPGTSKGGAADAAAAGDTRLVKGDAGLPELRPAGELKPPAIALPNDPVEPYLLSKDAGPFMVMAKVFRGPDAERTALALVKELRNDYGLPAYILRTKDFPGDKLKGSVAAGARIAPTGEMHGKFRTIEEAAVMVGNEQSPAGQAKLHREIQKLKPKCLEGVDSPFWWRKGLSSAIRATNPYVPARSLFPQAKDRLLAQMNAGLRSIANCPGRYSLQIADFSGRTAFQFNPNARAAQLLPSLGDSPLRKAADDAERMAEKLAKAPEIQRLGQPIYVYHDRTTSKVFIGSFNNPSDPAAGALRDRLVKDAFAISNKDKAEFGGRGKAATDTMIVPALALTDLSEIKATLRN